MNKVVEINGENFEAVVLRSPVTVLADFYSDRCGPCRQMMPVIEALANEVEGRAQIVTVDVAENEDLATRFGIQFIPTFIIFRDGQEVGRLRGVQTKAALLESLGLRE